MGHLKRRMVNYVYGAALGGFGQEHDWDVASLPGEFRVVERPGSVNGRRVIFVRVFKPNEAAEQGVAVTGWETLDRHPELTVFEGYVTESNHALVNLKTA